jgi:hypothetical protein
MSAQSPILINIGVSPNDGAGDPLRTAFNSVNDNLRMIFERGVPGSELNIVSNTVTVAVGSTFTDLIVRPGAAGDVIVDGDRLVIAAPLTPATSKGAVGDRAGSCAWNSSFFYVCVANYTNGATNIWRRLPLPSTTW